MTPPTTTYACITTTSSSATAIWNVLHQICICAQRIIPSHCLVGLMSGCPSRRRQRHSAQKRTPGACIYCLAQPPANLISSYGLLIELENSTVVCFFFLNAPSELIWLIYNFLKESRNVKCCIYRFWLFVCFFKSWYSSFLYSHQ